MRTLRIAVQAAEGRWLLCERKLVEKLETPLPELGEEHPLDEPRASQRFLLRATERPRLCSDVALLSALLETELKRGQAARGRTTLDFLAPYEFVGGLGGSTSMLTRLLMISLALAAPGRSMDFLGKESVYPSS